MKAIRTSTSVRAMESKRPMTQSERARLQPRDDRGRFKDEGVLQRSKGGVLLFRGRIPTESEISSRGLSELKSDLIVVDESNMFSSRTDGHRKNLTVVCTRVYDRKGYGDVVKRIPSKKGVRSKYVSTREPDLSHIVRAISEQDISIVERHRNIDYCKVSSPESKKELYISVLEDAVRDAIKLDPERETDVIIDSIPFKADQEIEGVGRILSQEGARIRWFETRKSASDRYLSVHDYETGVIADHVEGIGETAPLFDILRRRFRGE